MHRPAFHPTATAGIVATASWVGIALVELSCGVVASNDCSEKATCLGGSLDATLEASPDGADWGLDAGFDDGSDGTARDDDGGVLIDGGADGPSHVVDSGSFDVATADATDGAATNASDAMADTGCVNSFLGGGGQLLFSFDSAASATGWLTENNVADAGPSAATPGWTGADGHACPGALTLTAPFPAYTSVFPDVEFNFGRGTSWNATKLHLWVKVQIPAPAGGASAYAALSAVSPFVQSNGWSNYSFMWLGVTPSFGDGAWHEVVEDLLVPDGGQPNRGGPDVSLVSVQRVGVWLVPQATQPAGGPTAPSTTVLLVDDIWLE